MPFKLSSKETSEQYTQGEYVVYIPIDRTPRSAVGLITEILTGETQAESASPKICKKYFKKVKNILSRGNDHPCQRGGAALRDSEREDRQVHGLQTVFPHFMINQIIPPIKLQHHAQSL